MKKFQQNSIRTDGFHTRPNRANRALTTPSACGSHPFNTLKGNLFPNLTVLCSTVFLFFLLLTPFASRAQTLTLNDGDNYTANISIGFLGTYTVIVPSGTATISGSINGSSGTLKKTGAGKLIIASSNPSFWGIVDKLVVEEGKLQMGNGVNFCQLGIGSNNFNAVTIYDNATLRFEPDTDWTFWKNIHGSGNVEVKGGPGLERKLFFMANHTYTGTTTIESGWLYLGDNTNTGMVNGNIITTAQGSVAFKRSNDCTYSGVISGGGYLRKDGGGSLILTGVNTYTGSTTIESGTLILDATGKIESSSEVKLTGENAKFDISSANKMISNLNSLIPAAEVIIGSKTLTIGRAAKSDDGGGEFRGKFSGTNTGTVSKNGSATLFLNNVSFSGDIRFSHTPQLSGKKPVGLVKIAGTWPGTFASGYFEVLGNVTLGSNLLLNQGDQIVMNLTTSPPAKITCNGSFKIAGTKTIIMNITTNEVTLYTLITSNSGITSDILTQIKLNMSGMTGTLSAGTPSTLLLTATKKDFDPPVPGASGEITGTAEITEAQLFWSVAKDVDDVTPQEDLRYYVYQSESDNISTVADCETNGTLLNFSGTIDTTSYMVTGLTPSTSYYFNVVVSDMANNKAAYQRIALTTKEEAKITSIEISPKTATVLIGKTQQFIATVTAIGGANENVTWSISGQTSMLTSITPDGLLTVGDNETGKTLTVKVVSVFDPKKFDEATVSVNNNIGIKPITNNEIQITVYPNPTTGELNIQSSTFKVQGVEIYDVQGRKVYEDSNSSDLTVLRSYDLTVFPAGIYFVRIATEQGIVTKKIIKQ